MNIITLTTDIGWFYASQMKGSILSINPDAKIVDVTHDIHPQNIIEGAYVLYSATAHFPEAVHVAVVDPGVGTERRSLIVECKRGYFIGPDNGILIPAARRLGIKEIYEITETEYMASGISDTFHGRDIFAPVAAHLSLGVKANEIGIPCHNYKDMDFGNVVTGRVITGKIIFIDKFGSMITNVPNESLGLKYGDWVKIRAFGKELKVKFLRSYGYAGKGEILLTVSSSNFLEISLRDGNAYQILRGNIGDSIEIVRVID